MKKTVLYPFKGEDIPYILSEERVYNQYEISAVVAPCGSGLCGKDISYADNRDEVGIVVGENLEKALEKSDAILITSGKNERYNIGLESILDKALYYEKDIICNIKLSENKRREIARLCKQKKRTFIYGLEEKLQWRDTIYTSMHRLRTPVVFVTSILANANNLELMMKVKRKLTDEGYNVLMVGATPEIQMYGGLYSDVMNSIANGKFISNSVPLTVKLLNQFFWCAENQKEPDVMIVELPGGLVETPDFPNESGVYAYTITKAIQADYVIGTTLYGNYTNDSITQLNNEIKKRFGFKMNSIHVSNKMIHLSSSLMRQAMEFIYLPQRKMNSEPRKIEDVWMGNFLEAGKEQIIVDDMLQVMGAEN